MEAVRAALAATGGTASAQESGAAVRVSRVSARRYLEHLVAEGLARAKTRYGTSRPENRYLWLG